MGVDYYLFKKDKKEIYDMGKSAGHAFFQHIPFKIKEYNKYEGDLELEIQSECEHFGDYERIVKEGWFKTVAEDIIDWCGDDEIICILDMGENITIYENSKDWKEIGYVDLSGWYNKEFKTTGNIYRNNDYQSDGYKNKYKDKVDETK